MEGAPIIYVIDDDEAVRDSFEVLLESYGFAVRGYGCAMVFLAEFVPSARDCVILDIHMPEPSGLEVLEVLRARGLSQRVVAICGRASPDFDRLVRQAGARLLLAKPVKAEELIAAVNQVIGAA
jgi:two-component system response regulator FixJ